MKLQKIILCVAVSLTAFGASLGLLEIGSYLRTGFQPLRTKVRPIPVPTIVYRKTPVPYKQPVGVGFGEADIKIENESDEPDAAGEYYIVGTAPKGFEDFDSMWILTERYDEKTEKVIPTKPHGAIQTTKEFKFKWITVSGKQVSLVTQTHKGVSYQFDGKLVDEEEKHKTKEGYEYKANVALKGRLTKWLNGKKIAETKVKFEFGGC